MLLPEYRTVADIECQRARIIADLKHVYAREYHLPSDLALKAAETEFEIMRNVLLKYVPKDVARPKVHEQQKAERKALESVKPKPPRLAKPKSYKRLPVRDHRGNVFTTYKEMAEFYGISFIKFKYRRYIMKLSLEETLTAGDRIKPGPRRKK